MLSEGVKPVSLLISADGSEVWELVLCCELRCLHTDWLIHCTPTVFVVSFVSLGVPLPSCCAGSLMGDSNTNAVMHGSLSAQKETSQLHEPNGRRKRKANRPVKYLLKEDENDAQQYTEGSASLKEEEKDRSEVTGKRSGRLRDRIVKHECRPIVAARRRTVRPRRKKRRPLKSQIHPTLLLSPANVQGLVLKVNSDLNCHRAVSLMKDGEEEDELDDLRPWESNTLPPVPVWPYRVYAPIFVPEGPFEDELGSDAAVPKQDMPVKEELISQPGMNANEKLQQGMYSPPSTIGGSLSKFCGQVCYPLSSTGNVMIVRHPTVIETPYISSATNSTLVGGLGCSEQKEKARERMRSKRADPVYRAAEINKTRERMQRARQDPHYREKERTRHREQQRLRRAYAAKCREQKRDILCKVKTQHQNMRVIQAMPKYREIKGEDNRSTRFKSGDSMKPGLVNKELVHCSEDTWLSNSIDHDAVTRLKTYWNSQEDHFEWTAVNPDTHESSYSTCKSSGSSLSNLKDGQDDNYNFSAFISPAGIHYVHYDEDRDSDGAAGCRIGSSSNSVGSPDTPQSDCAVDMSEAECQSQTAMEGMSKSTSVRNSETIKEVV